jgi:ABC-2 type transport system permease protein
MLWYKSWLETRWRFLIGLALLMCSAGAIVLTYPRVQELLPLLPAVDAGGELGRRIREAVDLSREYRGFVWTQGFRQNLAQTGTVFAVLLGTGGLLSGGAVLFTLSLPATRRQLLRARAAAGLIEWLLLALVPALLIPLMSPMIGESYPVAGALAHGVCLFVAGAVFFSLAVLLSTCFTDVWRPLLIALAAAASIAIIEQFTPNGSGWGIYRVMSGEAYFRTGSMPWTGLLVSAAASAALLYSASVNLERRDF